MQLLPQMSPAAATTGSPSTVAAPPDGTNAIEAAESIDVATAIETTLRSIEPPFQRVNIEYKSPTLILGCPPGDQTTGASSNGQISRPCTEFLTSIVILI